MPVSLWLILLLLVCGWLGAVGLCVAATVRQVGPFPAELLHTGEWERMRARCPDVSKLSDEDMSRLGALFVKEVVPRTQLLDARIRHVQRAYQTLKTDCAALQEAIAQQLAVKVRSSVPSPLLS